MARIRTIKPELLKHTELFDAEIETGFPMRIAYIGLFTIADREGRFKWQPRSLKTDVLPYDAIDFSDVLEEFVARGFVIKYEVDGKVYGFIPSFKNHQCINSREAQSSLPPYQEEFNCNVHTHASTCDSNHVFSGVNIPSILRNEILKRDGDKCLRCFATENLTIDHILPKSMGGTHHPDNLRILCRSCNSGRPVQGDPLFEDLKKDGFDIEKLKFTCMHVQTQGEGKGREGKGRSNMSTSPRVENKNPEIKKQAIEVLNFLIEKTGRPFRAVDTNLKLIEARLKSGATVQQCRQVIAKKCRDWLPDAKMCAYLRPATLFNATKFEQYLGELLTQPGNQK